MTGLVLALVFALRERRPAARLALALAIVGTASGVRTELRVRGRPAALTTILAVTWLVSAVLAVAGHRYRVL